MKGRFDARKGGNFAVRIGGKFYANAHHVIFPLEFIDPPPAFFKLSLEAKRCHSNLEVIRCQTAGKLYQRRHYGRKA